MNLNRVIQPAALTGFFYMAMEMAWLAGVFLFLDWVIEPVGRPSLVWLAAFEPIACSAALLVRGRKRSVWLEGVMCAAIMTAAFYFFLGPDWNPVRDGLVKRGAVVLVGGGFCWYRGRGLAGGRVSLETMAAGWQTGTVILLTMLFALARADIPGDSHFMLAVLFFLSGLTGLCLARVAESSRAGGSSARAFLLTMAPAAILLTLGIGWWLSSVVDRAFLEVLISPVVWLWDQLAVFLHWLASLFPDSPRQVINPPQAPAQGPPQALLDKPFWDFSWLRKTGEVIFLGATLILIIAAVLRSLGVLIQWLQTRFGFDHGARREDLEVGFWDDVKEGLKVVKRLALWLIGRLMGVLGDRLAPGEAARVRRSYRRLLGWGASRGVPRRPDQTPLEYLDSLSNTAAQAMDAVESLTLAYLLVRYAPGQASPGCGQVAEDCWKKIKKCRRQVI